MNWTRHQDPAGFTIEVPEGWVVQSQPGLVMAASPDGFSTAVLESLPQPPPGTPGQILERGLFSSAGLFAGGQFSAVRPLSPSLAERFVTNRTPRGAVFQARITCRAGDRDTTVLICTAPQNAFAQVEPALVRILDSYRPAGGPVQGGRPPVASARSASPPLAPGAGRPASAGPLEFVNYTERQSGTFTIDIPRGWQVRSGFHHANLGDRRMFIEVQSPSGIQVMCGDPECPQSFCHQMLTPGGTMVPYPSGCVFMSLAPSGQSLAEYYMKKIAPRRFGGFRITGAADRRDRVEAALARMRQAGVNIPRSLRVSLHEIRFDLGGRIGSCTGGGVCDTQWDLGLGTSWEGNVTIWIAPPDLAALAEQVSIRMTETFRGTERLAQIVQRDEALIASNGAAANMAQHAWFGAQQQTHAAQAGFGEQLVNNYWDQQRANEQWAQGWHDNQAAVDRSMQASSDAMLGRQRLYDDALGKPYDASGGSNYYWLDQQTGQVIGTNAADPPDYQRNYTLLRKL